MQFNNLKQNPIIDSKVNFEALKKVKKKTILNNC